jgi:hypothetical protein
MDGPFVLLLIGTTKQWDNWATCRGEKPAVSEINE